jgi:hypothetical protein
MMHRLIISIPKEMVTDHKNGNRLDNRKENLRACTQAQNTRNRGITQNINHSWKGYTYEKSRNKFKASIKVNGKSINLGRYETEHEAATAYNLAAKKYFGDFARLNIIKKEN